MNLVYFNPYYIKDDYGYYMEKIDYYREKRKEFKNNNLKLLELLQRSALSKENFRTIVLNQIEVYKQCGFKPSDLVIAFDNNYNRKTFSQKELENLKELSELVKPLGVKLGIYDYRDVFEYDKVANADKKIKQMAYEINSHNYSPLEKLLHMHLIINSRPYIVENENKDVVSLSRSVYGILNDEKCVCNGFSELYKAVAQEIDDKNMKVFANRVGCLMKDNKIMYHQNNVIYLNDEKYKIKGFYYDDVTGSSKKMENFRIDQFLIPVKEIKNKKGFVANDFTDTIKLQCKKLKQEKKYVKIKKPTKNLKRKTNNLSPTNKTMYSSLSFDKLHLDEREINYSDYSDCLLTPYLMNRKDFFDYLVLTQTEKDMFRKKKKSSKQFTKTFEKNYEKVSPLEFGVFKNKKAMWQYMNEHSPNYSIDAIYSALNVVMKNIDGEKTKNDASKKAYEVLKYNINLSKSMFKENAQTALSECEIIK